MENEAASEKAHAPTPASWKPGQSGNPSGNPPGKIRTVAKTAKALVEKFYADMDDIADTVIEQAKAGDLQAAEMILKRIVAPLKPRAQYIDLKLDTKTTLSEQAETVLAAVVTGQIDPETGNNIINSITHFAKLRETDELSARLARIEAALGVSAGASVGTLPLYPIYPHGEDAQPGENVRADLATRWTGAETTGKDAGMGGPLGAAQGAGALTTPAPLAQRGGPVSGCAAPALAGG